MRYLNTVDDVIEWLGGPTKAAAWLDVTDNAICLWRHRHIPRGHHSRLIARAVRENVVISNDVFDMPEEDYRVFFKPRGVRMADQAVA